MFSNNKIIDLKTLPVNILKISVNKKAIKLEKDKPTSQGGFFRIMTNRAKNV